MSPRSTSGSLSSSASSKASDICCDVPARSTCIQVHVIQTYKSMSYRHTSPCHIDIQAAKVSRRLASVLPPVQDLVVTKTGKRLACSLSLELFDSVTYTVCQGGHRNSRMKTSAGAISRQALVFFLLAPDCLYRCIGRIRISTA